MSRANFDSILRKFAKSNKGYVAPEADYHLNSEIGAHLENISSHLFALQKRIDDQEKLIKSLLKEIDK